MNVDEVDVVGLGAVRLGSGAWALVSWGSEQLTLWDPLDLSDAGSPLLQVDVSAAWAMAVVPATAAAPGLIVTSEQEGVRVIDPESGRTVFRAAVGDPLLLRLAGGRFGDEKAGFAVVGYDGRMELWAPDGSAGAGEWRRRDLRLDSSDRPDDMVFLTGADGDSLVAIATKHKVAVWNLRTEKRVIQANFDVSVDALTPVPLGDRTLLALGFTKRQNAGVQLWDPHTQRLVGEVFHLVGRGPDDLGGNSVRAIVGIPGQDRSVRVASGTHLDSFVRVSAPLDLGVLPGAENATEGTQDSPQGTGAKTRVTKDTEVRAATVSAAIEAFTDAIEATPVIDQDRLQAEYDSLRKAWGVKGLVNGSFEEITEILRVNLEIDARRLSGTYFVIDFMEYNQCTQVNTMHSGGFGPYRVWRTADGLSLYSNRQVLRRRDEEQRVGKLWRWWRRR
ncbi:hypothetical protein SAMN04489712_13044 [Thermomonospora echinospora]|uniref:WD40 repeat domain-containing protein n=1 Tax=Thermomonospora echinospora TaxID=1992 RepID=A0A1H6E3Z8_9ACTN|nr:hypothetical protein [Thermomonospora echinospora]SEG91764.1 hypothetical protein SAMN04489712_13044 [Thermomonospora echinospora]